MPLAQIRFIRLFWVIWPIFAGYGFVVFRDKFEKLQNPLVLFLVFFLLFAPFVVNARADTHASENRPIPHGGQLPGEYYHSLLDCFNWLEENTSSDSIVAIPWSYGHFLTGAANRYSVTDGAQNFGRRGSWCQSFGIKPPDYIRYVENDNGYIVGVNTPPENFRINGRRIDVQSMMGFVKYRILENNKTSWFNERESAYILDKYREDFGIQIDYIVFNNYAWGETSIRENVLLSLRKRMEDSKSVGKKGDSYIFEFQKENIQFNFREGVSSFKSDENLRGYVTYDEQTGELESNLEPDTQDSGILWVYITDEKEDGFVQVKENSYIEDVGLLRLNDIPLLIRALDDLEMPNYLREVYRESQSTVFRVVPENIPLDKN